MDCSVLSLKTVIENSIGDTLGESSPFGGSFGRSPHVVTELSPDCLSISWIQMLSNNGFTHVSQEVSIEYTKHKCVCLASKSSCCSGSLPGV